MYVSIDIETTGLNPKDQVLEFAAVAWDAEDVMECSWFHRYIYWEHLRGQPRALHMNRKYIELLSEIKVVDSDNAVRGGIFYEGDKLLDNWIWPKDLGWRFRAWMDEQGICKAYPLGKQVAKFDLQFLEKMPNWPSELFKHRCLDVGTLAASRLSIPSLFDIPIKRTIPGNQHEALYDARYALQVAMERL